MRARCACDAGQAPEGADTLLAAAREVREHPVERVERAAREIERRVAEQRAATGIAKCGAADPGGGTQAR